MGKISSFKRYRALCDAAGDGSYRKLGIIDHHGYGAALKDPRTVVVTLQSGETVPVFVAMEYVGGYDAKRTEALADSKDVRLLAVPLALMKGIDISTLGSAIQGATIAVETPIEATQSAKAVLPRLLSDTVGGDWQVHDFKDPRCPESRQNANISVYEAGFEAHDASGKLLLDTGKTLTKSARELGIDGEVKIIGSREIHKNPELLAELWDLCANKFDQLGKFHPVSMEETQTFFEKMLGNQRTHSLVRFEQGKPVAHGFFMDDLSGAMWMSDEYIDSIEARAAKKNEKILFFYGIVSRSTPEASMHYSASIMKTLSHLGKYSGGAYRLVFESTNLSSLYIPRLVEEYTKGDANGMTMVEPIKRITGIDYWYIKAD